MSKSTESDNVSLQCPKCGGFLQNFKNIEVCRDCGHVTKTFPIPASKKLTRFLIVSVKDGKKTITPFEIDDIAIQYFEEHEDKFNHEQIHYECDAFADWDLGLYELVKRPEFVKRRKL
jgi:hypothetical protein